MKTFTILSATLLLVFSAISAVWSPLNAQTEAPQYESDGNRATQTSFAQNESSAPAQKKTSKSAKDEQNRKIQKANLARNILLRARETHRQLKSFQANIEQTVNIGDRSFKASGIYQQSQDLRMRLQLNMKLDYGVKVMNSSLLQVCDGEVLRTLRTFGKQQRLTRRNVKQILAAAATKGGSVYNAITVELGMGGIHALLASIQRCMVFDSHKTMKSGEETIHVLEGTWNSQYQAHWKGATPNRDRLPEHVPDRVRLYIDSGYILRRIEYLKNQPDNKQPVALLSMQLKDIKLNLNFKNSDFVFKAPPKVFSEDVTEVYINQLNPPRRTPVP
ncbi:MAG: hypothetical protein Tsb009_22190 [Planctomycetaceae bacterium]